MFCGRCGQSGAIRCNAGTWQRRAACTTARFVMYTWQLGLRVGSREAARKRRPLGYRAPFFRPQGPLGSFFPFFPIAICLPTITYERAGGLARVRYRQRRLHRSLPTSGLSIRCSANGEPRSRIAGALVSRGVAGSGRSKKQRPCPKQVLPLKAATPPGPRCCAPFISNLHYSF